MNLEYIMVITKEAIEYLELEKERTSENGELLVSGSVHFLK